MPQQTKVIDTITGERKIKEDEELIETEEGRFIFRGDDKPLKQVDDAFFSELKELECPKCGEVARKNKMGYAYSTGGSITCRTCEVTYQTASNYSVKLSDEEGLVKVDLSETGELSTCAWELITMAHQREWFETTHFDDLDIQLMLTEHGSYDIDLHVWIISHGEHAVGIIRGIETEDKAIIKNLFVNPIYRREGYGRKLVEQWAEKQDKPIKVEYIDDAKEFYEKCDVEFTNLN